MIEQNVTGVLMNESFPQKISRRAAPSLLDSAPYLSLCEVDDGTFYIQMSKDDEYPVWFLFDGTEDKAKEFIGSILNNKTPLLIESNGA